MTSNWEKSDGLVHYSVKNAAVLCENHHERVTQIGTSPSEEEEEERKTFWLSGDFLVQYFRDAFFLVPLDVLFIMKTLEDER